MSLYINDVDFNTGVALSDADLENLKQGLKDSCKFIFSSSTKKAIDRPKLKFVARFYQKDKFYYYHVTNMERRKILKILSEFSNAT
jgi:hypothetical protein